MFLRFQPLDPPFLFGTNQTCSRTSRFFRIFPIMYYFANHGSMEILFYFCFVLLLFFFFLKFCFIIFLHWAAWILFLVNNNKGFPSGPLLMLLNGGIWSRHSKINQFKTSKNFFFQK